MLDSRNSSMPSFIMLLITFSIVFTFEIGRKLLGSYLSVLSISLISFFLLRKSFTNTIIGLLLSNRKIDAVRELEKKSALSAEEIEKKLDEVPISQNTVEDKQVKELVGKKTVPAYELTSQESLWLSENTPTFGSYRFDVIGTKEELFLN